PNRPPIALEAEWRERAIVSATAGDSSPEQVRVRQKIGSHKSAVAVAAHAYSFRIGRAHLHGFVDCSLRAGDNLLHISIVHGFRVADDRHGGVIEDGVTLRYQK